MDKENVIYTWGFPGGSAVKNLPAMQKTYRRHGFDPWVGQIPCSRKWQLTPVFLSEEPHGHEFEQTPGDSERQGSLLQSIGSQRVGHGD